MRHRRLGRAVRCAIAALLLAPAVASAAVAVPDASDTRRGARPLGGSFIAAIDRPGDHDWYTLPGGDIGELEIVDISVVMSGPGCTATQPLFVVFRNPEGRWIRTYSVSRERTDVLVSVLPGRYYLEVRAADSSCTSLVYGLSIISQTIRFAEGIDQAIRLAQTYRANEITLCRIAHNERVRATVRIRLLQQRRRSLRSRASRRRYAGYVKEQRRALKRARAKERRACAKFG